MGLFSRNKSETDEQTETDGENGRAVIEGEYDPTKPKRINGKEWWIERINEHNKLETYAGEWCRAMIENAVYEPRQPLWLGCSERSGREFGIEFKNNFQHSAYLGSTGSGKTTAIHNSVIQLVMGGHGVGIIDPKGDDIIEFLRKIPKRRWDDVVYVDIAGSWTIEDPETGEDVPHTIGFNVLETYHDHGDPGYDAEVQWIVENFMKIAGIRESWSLAQRTLKTIVRWMTRHDEEFTIIEVFYALSSEENRGEFSHLIGQNVEDEDIIFIEDSLQAITENMTDEQLDPLLGKLRDWIEEPMTRRIVAQRESGITLSEVVNEKKILVVNNDLPKELRKKMANVIKTGVWSAVTGRMDETEHKLMQAAGIDVGDNVYEPFFLSIDECHAVFTEEDNIEEMLMEARSKELGFLLSTQTLRSLPKSSAHAIVSNCRTVISMDPGDPEEARLIADKFGDIDPAELQRVPDFHALTQLNNEDDPFMAKMLPPYPPRHSIEEAYELIQLSLENYGAPILSGQDIVESIHFDVGINFDRTPEEDNSTESEKRTVIKSVHDASIRQSPSDRERYDGYVPAGEVLDFVVQEWDVSRERAAHTIEILTSIEFLDRRRHEDDGMLLSPSADGLEYLGLDSGSNQTGGGAEHRSWLLPQAYQTLTRAGYSVTIPEQGDGDGELPDGVAEPVMDLSLPDGITTLAEQEQALQDIRDRLEADYPVVARLSGGSTLYVEAEHTGNTSPAGPLKNLSKADGPVLFVVAQEGSGGADKARKIRNIITDPTSDKTPPDTDVRLYTGGDFSVENDVNADSDVKSGKWFVAAPKGTDRAEWVRFGEKIVLRRHDTRDVIVEFEDAAAFENATPEDFPIRYRYDDDASCFVVIDETDPAGETDRRKYSSKKSLRKVETCVKTPTVPEVSFPEGIPEYGDAWRIAVVPNDGSDLLHYDIETDSLSPLLDAGEDLDHDSTEAQSPESPESTVSEEFTESTESDEPNTYTRPQEDGRDETVEERLRRLGID